MYLLCHRFILSLLYTSAGTSANRYISKWIITSRRHVCLRISLIGVVIESTTLLLAVRFLQSVALVPTLSSAFVKSLKMANNIITEDTIMLSYTYQAENTVVRPRRNPFIRVTKTANNQISIRMMRTHV